MKQEVRSIRSFIGAKDYAVSRTFYRDLGFDEIVISPTMSLFRTGAMSFYLQDYYVKEWIENSMVLLEVDDVDAFWLYLLQLQLDKNYQGVRLIATQQNDWGKECMLIDPSGILWHFAEFST